MIQVDQTSDILSSRPLRAAVGQVLVGESHSLLSLAGIGRAGGGQGGQPGWDGQTWSLVGENCLCPTGLRSFRKPCHPSLNWAWLHSQPECCLLSALTKKRLLIPLP